VNVMLGQSSGDDVHKYPSSSHYHHNWDALEAQMKAEEKDEKLEGDAALNKLFQQIYTDGSDETRRAMNKSFVSILCRDLIQHGRSVCDWPVKKKLKGVVFDQFNIVKSRTCFSRSVCIISSFHELMQSRGVRRLSVCPSVCPSVCKLCANRYFYHRNGWIATKLAHDGPQKNPHPGCAQGQRSRDTDTFLPTRKSLLPQT